MAFTPSTPAQAALQAMCAQYLRPCTIEGGAIVFNPPLTAPEQTTFNRLVNLSKSLISGITPAEWEALEPDIAGLVTFQGLPSPTLAQTVLAVKAQSRVLRALIKN